MTTYTTASSNYRQVVRDTNLNDIGNILRIVGINNSGRLNGEPQVVYFVMSNLSDHERPRTYRLGLQKHNQNPLEVLR